MAFLSALRSRGGASDDDGVRPAHLQEWLDAVVAAPPADAAESIVKQVARIRRGNTSVWNRLKLLDVVHERVDRIVPILDRQLAVAPLPLAAPAQRGFDAANRLLKDLAGGYNDTAQTIAAKWVNLGFSKPLQAPVLSAMRLTAQRINLAYRIYAHGSKPAWLDLHRFYSMAREGGFATALSSGEETPERIYIKALLLALADPTHFVAGQLNHVLFYLERFGHLAELAPPPSHNGDVQARAGSFLVSPRDPGPGKSLIKWAPERILPGDLVLICDSLIERLEEQIDGLEKRIAPAKLGLPKIAAETQYLHMLRTLRAMWNSPPSRVHQRSRFHPRADIFAGFSTLWDMLSTGNGQPIAAAPATAQSGKVNGSSEWAIINESPNGFGLKYVGGSTEHIKVGEVLALKQRNAPDLHVCIVRREVNRHVDGLELGLQALAARAIPANITIRNAGSSEASGRREQIILLPSLPGHGNTPAILVPPDSVISGTKFSALNRGQRTTMRVGKRLERTLSCEIFALEQVEA